MGRDFATIRRRRAGLPPTLAAVSRPAPSPWPLPAAELARTGVHATRSARIPVREDTDGCDARRRRLTAPARHEEHRHGAQGLLGDRTAAARPDPPSWPRDRPHGA